MNVEEILEKVGFSKNEAKIYVTLSKIGSSTAYKIAKEAKVFKANTYQVLKKLEEKGLVIRRHSEKKEIYEAQDPSFITNMLERKKRDVDEIIPRLRLLQQTPTTESQISTHKGANGLKNVMYSFFEFDEPIYSWGIPKDVYTYVKGFIGEFHKERVRVKKKFYHIYNHDATERVKVLKTIPHTPIRRLSGLFDSEVSTMVCGSMILFTIWKEPIKNIVIKDEDMALAYKNFFQILWTQAKPF